MNFRQLKKAVKSLTGVILVKGLAGTAYAVVDHHGYSKLKGLEGNPDLPTFEVAHVVDMGEDVLEVNILF